MDSTNPRPPAHPITSEGSPHLSTPATEAHPAHPAGDDKGRSNLRLIIAGVVIGVVVIVVAALFFFDVPMPWKSGSARAEGDKGSSPLAGVQMVDPKTKENTLLVPNEVLYALGILGRGPERIYEAKLPTRMRQVTMPGSTALDPGRLYRIRVRFAPCEASEIAKVRDIPPALPGGLPSMSYLESRPMRELRTGDRVKKGDLLAVVFSVDVGQQKNALIDAVSQLKLDEKILDAADKSRESVPEVYILNCQRNVEADHNNISKAMNTLKAWNIPKEDIEACFREADEIFKRRGHREHNEADLAKWARVELRAPEDGVIVERNVSVHETVVDNTVNLFQIAQIERLSVFANVPEDEVPALEALPTTQRFWTIKTVGSAPAPGVIDDIGYIIDPNQHTAVVKGHIDNPTEVMRAGQFISATVDLPPPLDVVEVPVDAVIEDGQTSIVFVQDKNNKDWFTMRRVQPTQRFEKTVFIRSKPFSKSEERTTEEEELKVLPKAPLLPGERILTSGVGELKAALLDLQSQPKTESK
jgi:membrane fusion protein, heavy metal efflux system